MKASALAIAATLGLSLGAQATELALKSFLEGLGHLMQRRSNRPTKGDNQLAGVRGFYLRLGIEHTLASLRAYKPLRSRSKIAYEFFSLFWT